MLHNIQETVILYNDKLRVGTWSTNQNILNAISAPKQGHKKFLKKCPIFWKVAWKVYKLKESLNIY